jgi:hypothetical protein
MNDNDDEPFDRYTERASATLAYRLMEYLEFLGVITDEHVNYLRWPPIELIEDAEKALKDEAWQTPQPNGSPVITLASKPQPRR